MSGRKGAGGPTFFRCWRCRREHRGSAWKGCGGVGSVAFTFHARFASAHESRSGGEPIAVEYRCRCCGHVGWSNHRDLVARYAVEL